MSHLHRGQRR